MILLVAKAPASLGSPFQGYLGRLGPRQVPLSGLTPDANEIITWREKWSLQEDVGLWIYKELSMPPVATLKIFSIRSKHSNSQPLHFDQ